MKISALGRIASAMCLLLFSTCSFCARAATPPASILLSPMSVPSATLASPLSVLSWYPKRMGLPASLSLSRQEGNWSLYSYSVNKITCADTAGPGGSEETWLGTQGGIKRLNARGRLIKFYTIADGLPGGEVIALAVEPKEAWSIVVSDQAPSAYCLCRLDRVTDRWMLLRQVPLPEVSCTDQSGAASFIAVRATHSVCFVLGNVARSQSGLAALVFDRVTHRWRDVSWENGQRTGDSCFPYLEPTWAGAASEESGDCLYLGTAQGLGRYRIDSGHWDWFLSGYFIVGGTEAGRGVLWLTALPKDGTPYVPPTANLHLLRFDEEKGSAEADYQQGGVGPDVPGQSALTFPGSASGIVAVSEDGIWIVSRRGGGFFHARDNLAAALTRFDLKNRLWQSVDTTSSSVASGLPLPVLRAALLADYGLPTPILKRRLPGWVSPAAVLPADDVPAFGQESRKLSDLDGAVWSVKDKTILTRRASGGSAVQNFLPPAQTMLLNPQTYLTTIADSTLSVLTLKHLWRKHLPDGAWASTPLPPGVIPSDTASFFEWQKKLWLITDHVWRWNPATEHWVSAGTSPGEFLGVNGSDLWFDQFPGGLLWRMPFTGAASELVRVNIFEKDNNSRGFFGLSGGYAWLTVQEGSARIGDTLLYGYDVTARTWLAPLRMAGQVYKLSMKAAEGGVYATVVQRIDASGDGSVGDTYLFDSKTQQWETISPTVPPLPGGQHSGSIPDHVRFISADDRSLWLLDTETLAGWRWDRTRRIWNSFPATAPAERRIEANDNDGVVSRWEDQFFAATQNGVRRFDLDTQRWTVLPMPIPAASLLTLRLSAVDNRAVWALAYSPAGQVFATRFDKTKQTWKLWGAANGFPESGQPDGIVEDGISAFATTYPFGAYRLNPKTDHWDDVSSALAPVFPQGPGGMDLSRHTLAGDPPGIWISGYRTSQRKLLANRLSSPSPLIYWNGLRARFEAVPSPKFLTDGPNTVRWSDCVLVDRRAVWVIGYGSLWRLDKATRSWVSFALPAEFPAYAESIRRTPDGAIWLTGHDSVIRWLPPIRFRDFSLPPERVPKK